ncbi:MAG: glutamyl-tRNA reductase [Actinomycetales bacterium]|nr:glutamyl-tRNA reductase [Actinomycetales bacterium]
MTAVLVCVSVSHRTANFAVLERLSAHSPGPTAFLADEAVRGAVVVATCNRYEAYLDVTDDSDEGVAAAISGVVERLARAAGLPPTELSPRTRVMTSSRVAAHLFAVASGLESVVVGENEIAGQVRRALTHAHASGAATPALERLFQAASTTSRGVRSSTHINAAGRSMVRLALDLAESRVPDWRAAHVLLVGTGAYAGTTLAALRDRGVHTVHVFSPSGREQQFATREGVRPVPRSAWHPALAQADLVLTSTTVRVLDAATLAVARAQTDRRQLIVDLGLPSNVDKDVTRLPGVELLDLETISRHAPVHELNASAQARDLVVEAAREFQAQAAEAGATPAIVAYRAHVDALLDAELARSRARGEHSDEVERALRHFAGALVHGPMTRARELARSGEVDRVADALSALHGIDIRVAQAPGDGCDAQTA